MNLIPSWLDLWHTFVWVNAVIIVAVLLGALWAVIDTFFTYGLPNFTEALDTPVTLRVKLPRSLSDKAAKGYTAPSPHVVDIATGRRRQARVH